MALNICVFFVVLLMRTAKEEMLTAKEELLFIRI